MTSNSESETLLSYVSTSIISKTDSISRKADMMSDDDVILNRQLTLQRMEDPIDMHVMPPPVRRLSTKKRVTSIIRKNVLSEEDYQEVMEKIIERDFYPDVAQYNSIIQSDLMDRSDVNLKTEALVSEYGTLDSFLTHNTSEDNDSFDRVAEKDLEERKRKYHWAYDADDSKRQGLLNMYYLGGGVLTEEQRAEMHRLLDGGDEQRRIGDDRQNAPNLWKFRVRNQLMFPPELRDSEDTCLITDTAENAELRSRRSLPASSALLLTDGKSASRKHLASSSSAPSARSIQHSNTRLPSDTFTPEWPIALERPHSPSEFSQAESMDSRIHCSDRPRSYRPVPMTPLIEPGVQTSPLITWGEVAETPIILHTDSDKSLKRLEYSAGASIAHDSNIESGQFRIKAPSRREKIAHSLDVRKPSATKAKRKVELPGSVALTPAALSLASRIRASVTPCMIPFGGDAKLSASYSSKMKRERAS